MRSYRSREPFRFHVLIQAVDAITSSTIFLFLMFTIERTSSICANLVVFLTSLVFSLFRQHRRPGGWRILGRSRPASRWPRGTTAQIIGSFTVVVVLDIVGHGLHPRWLCLCRLLTIVTNLSTVVMSDLEHSAGRVTEGQLEYYKRKYEV